MAPLKSVTVPVTVAVLIWAFPETRSPRHMIVNAIHCATRIFISASCDLTHKPGNSNPEAFRLSTSVK